MASSWKKSKSHELHFLILNSDSLQSLTGIPLSLAALRGGIWLAGKPFFASSDLSDCEQGEEVDCGDLCSVSGCTCH